MNKFKKIEEFDQAYLEIEDFRDKLGEQFCDFFNEEDNNTYEMGKSIISAIEKCETEREYEIADAMVIAVCGYSISSIIEKMLERDASGYVWESVG